MPPRKRKKAPAKPTASPNGPARWLRSPAAGAAVVFGLAFALYANTLGHEFVWDDRTLIVENASIHSLCAESIRSAFAQHYWNTTGKAGGLYRPLSTVSFQLDHALSGKDPAGYHRSNIILYACACALWFLLLVALFSDPALALIAAALFASYPLHTENVAWVSGRTDVLATTFMLASLLGFSRWLRGGRWIWAVLCILACAAALLSKEIAVVTPLLLALMAWGPFSPARQRHGARGAGLVVGTAIMVAAAYFVVRSHVIGAGVSRFEPFVTGVFATAALALSTFAHYLFRMVFPFRLNAEWEAPVVDSLASPHALAGLALVAFALAALWRFRRNPVVVWSLALVLLGLGPVLNLFPATEVSAERNAFVPSLGLTLLPAYGLLAAARKRRWRSVAVGLAALVVLAFSARTVTRNAEWRDESTLFATTVAAAGGESARAHLNLGNVHYRNGDYGEAIAEYRRAVDIDPDDARVWSGLAGCYKALGSLDDAFAAMERAIAIDPTDPDYHNSLGILLTERKDYARAVDAFRRAVEIQPEHDRARFNLALAAYLDDDLATARQHFELVGDKDGEFVHTHYYLAMIASRGGDSATAAEHAAHFLSLYDRSDDFRRSAQSLLGGR